MDKSAANKRQINLAEGLLAPDSVVHGYRIVRVLRAGGSNNVYVAVSPSGEEVAIKEYFPRRLARRLPSGNIGVANEKSKAQFENGVKGFANEAMALAEIRSDLLARCVGAFRFNGTAYIVTALEPGETLESWARRIIRTGKFPVEADLRFIFWNLLHAVQVMHDKGFLHLDIKPSNVIMRDENTPILIDLGGARRYPHRSGDFVSISNYTPGFAAPEQHEERFDTFGPTTDVYGIGASILYCSTGKIPPKADDRMKDDTIGDLMRRCETRYSRQFVEIVSRCMALVPEHRYTNIPELQNLISSQ